MFKILFGMLIVIQAIGGSVHAESYAEASEALKNSGGGFKEHVRPSKVVEDGFKSMKTPIIEFIRKEVEKDKEATTAPREIDNYERVPTPAI